MMPTREQVREYRDKHKVSVLVAQRALYLREMVAEVERMEAATIEEKVNWMMRLYKDGLEQELKTYD